MADKSEKPIRLPKSDVLQFFTDDGSKITVRPSGTEPKIKFYFGIRAQLNNVAEFEKIEQQCKDKIESIKADLKL
jgi:phosphoglucomutase